MAQKQKTWRVWCVRCGGVQLFRTPQGKAAPYTSEDWTDEAGHIMD